MRLLVIEDDATLRDSLCRQLVDAGFGVEQAADGREGLYFALEYPVDLAIIDLGLPEISGLDTMRQELKVNGAEIELTSFEYRIIKHLMMRAGEVISKTELTDRLYDQDFERDSNVIEVFIGRLRKKMDPDSTLQPIETLRGRGYRFALERNQDQ